MQENQTPDNEKKPSEDVISNYYDDVKELEMQGYQTGIRKARNALFFAAGIYLVWELIGLAISKIPFSLVPTFYWVILAAVVGSFIALGIWTRTKPYTAIIVGLILFILLWVLYIVLLGTEAIYRGILIRVIIIVILVRALKPAKAWEDLNKK